MDGTENAGCDSPALPAPPPDANPPEARPPVVVAGRPRRSVTQTQSSAEWRRAFAASLTLEQKYAIIDTLFEMGVNGQCFPALKELLDRGLGKPAVASDKVADDITADAIEAAGLDALSTEELHEYLRYQEKIRRRQLEVQGVTVEAPGAA